MSRPFFSLVAVSVLIVDLYSFYFIIYIHFVYICVIIILKKVLGGEEYVLLEERTWMGMVSRLVGYATTRGLSL